MYSWLIVFSSNLAGESLTEHSLKGRESIIKLSAEYQIINLNGR
jgi:hypothetical protein